MSKLVKSIFGVRESNKLAAIFAEIDDYEKEAKKLIVKTARAYYDAGNILAGAVKKYNANTRGLTAKTLSELSGFPERRIIIALKIFKHFENNPDTLKGLTLSDALKLIAPPSPAGGEGYNRVDLGGAAGQLQLNFDELFAVPAAVNKSLQNYRTVGEMINEIIVVRRTVDGNLTSKRFAFFAEDIPQNSNLRGAYKTMSQKTQAAIEDYLAALEQEED